MAFHCWDIIQNTLLRKIIVRINVKVVLYPTRLFRKCVSSCGSRRWHALHMFVESFQGQYKDGTNGTRDFRMVSASFLILRLLTMLLFLNHHRLSSHTSELQGVIFVCAVCFHAITRPYKLNFMNNVDIVILFLLEILTFAVVNPVPKFLEYFILGSVLLLGVPHMVLIFYLCCKLARKTGISQSLKRKYKTLKRCALATVCTSQADRCGR